MAAGQSSYRKGKGKGKLKGQVARPAAKDSDQPAASVDEEVSGITAEPKVVAEADAAPDVADAPAQGDKEVIATADAGAEIEEDDEDNDDEDDDEDDDDDDEDDYDDEDYDYDEDAAWVAGELFGRVPSDAEMKALVGAPPDADIEWLADSETVLTIRVRHPYIVDQRRVIKRAYPSGLRIVNDLFEVHRPPAPAGFGARSFARQVKALVEYNDNADEDYQFHVIEVHAAGSPHPDSWNGYYTWARFGYDAEIPRSLLTKLRSDDALPEEMREARTLNELILAGGAAWWKANGSEFFGEFDLGEGSNSRKILDDYIKNKAIDLEEDDEQR